VSIAMNLLNVSRTKALLLCIGIPLGIPIAGACGAVMLSHLDPSGYAFVAMISFGSAALMYLVADELLVEAHVDPDTDKWYITLQFFSGFLVTLLLQVRYRNSAARLSLQSLTCGCGCVFSFCQTNHLGTARNSRCTFRRWNRVTPRGRMRSLVVCSLTVAALIRMNEFVLNQSHHTANSSQPASQAIQSAVLLA